MTLHELLKKTKRTLNRKALNRKLPIVAKNAGVTLDRVCNIKKGRTKCRENTFYNEQQEKDLLAILQAAEDIINN